uniref:Uncharacterized protein n=1 Tax=Catagonus wagneri TaxID=51154 RepID=A0A8C3XDK5_9CETA
MCEIDSLASTFVPNLCSGPKGFPFSLENFFFRFYEFCVSLNYLWAFILSNLYCFGSIVCVYQFLFCFKKPLPHPSSHTYFF